MQTHLNVEMSASACVHIRITYVHHKSHAPTLAYDAQSNNDECNEKYSFYGSLIIIVYGSNTRGNINHLINQKHHAFEPS
jgi:hypothetical protein